MKANIPKAPRPWERLPPSQRKAIEEYYLELLRQQEEKDVRIMLDLYTKMTVCVLHDGHEMDEDELMCFLGNHKRLFQRHARMVREGTQLDYFNKRMAEIFPTSGFPQQFFDDMLGAVEEPVFDEQATANVDNKQSEWISVEERLPEDGQRVLIYDGGAYQWEPTVSCATFQKGKTAAQLKEEGYRIISGADEHGNNLKPYRWRSGNGPMDWFGQMVTHWMPLPELPKMKGGAE